MSRVRRRIHQGAFRERVLRAYRRKCAFCALQRVELLDAADVTPDDALRGEGVVNGGMSLCRLRFEGGAVGWGAFGLGNTGAEGYPVRD